MSTMNERWAEVYALFDPALPAPADLRVPRKAYNPMSEKIVPRLALPLDHQKFVLAGGIGSGKSTELRGTAESVAPDRLVVLVDLWQHFQATVQDPGALNHLQPAELVGLLGLAVLRVGTDQLGHDWRGLDTTLGDAIMGVRGAEPSGADPAPQVDVVKLARGVAVAVGGAAGALLAGPAGAMGGGAAAQVGLSVLDAVTDATSWRWRIGLRGRARPSDQDTPVRAVLQAVNALLDSLRTALPGRRIVLMVDGLDRVQDADTFAGLFVDSSLVADLRCDLVATLKLGLVQRFRQRLHGWQVFDFTYIPVAQRDAPQQPDAAGVAFLLSLAARRFESLGWADPIDDADLRRLAYRSGGRLRDFIKLVREVAVQAMLEDAPRADSRHVDLAIDELRRGLESGLDTAQIALLETVLGDDRRRLPAGDVALNMLDRQLLLAYPNETPWYLPHTALMLHLLRPRTGSPASG